MTVRLAIEIESPLTDDDRDLLAGLAVMTVAIANRQFDQQQPPADEDPAEGEPQPCGDMETVGDRNDAERQTYTGKVCVSPVGHQGRHKYRHVNPPGLGDELMPRPAEGLSQRTVLLRLRAAIDTAIAYPSDGNTKVALSITDIYPRAMRSAHLVHNLGKRRWDWLREHGYAAVSEVEGGGD